MTIDMQRLPIYVGCWEVLVAVVLHLRSCQDGYQLVTVHTQGDVIVLPHGETELPEP